MFGDERWAAAGPVRYGGGTYAIAKAPCDAELADLIVGCVQSGNGRSRSGRKIEVLGGGYVAGSLKKVVPCKNIL